MTEDFPNNEVEFDSRFHTEEACLDYLFQLRWPEGFSCSHCTGKHLSEVDNQIV